MPFTVLEVETSLFCARNVEEFIGEKLLHFGSSNTTEARLELLGASLDRTESETDPVLSPAELTDRLDSVLCILLFWMANFLNDVGESLLDFFSVPHVPGLASSTEELLGLAILDKLSSPV